ncbi:MAG TPA: hypothetical protein PKD65_11195, partial [Nitrospira sp.]|nr:hypothetical protein [Nitrospira sp.]
HVASAIPVLNPATGSAMLPDQHSSRSNAAPLVAPYEMAASTKHDYCHVFKNTRSVAKEITWKRGV